MYFFAIIDKILIDAIGVPKREFIMQSLVKELVIDLSLSIKTKLILKQPKILNFDESIHFGINK